MKPAAQPAVKLIATLAALTLCAGCAGPRQDKPREADPPLPAQWRDGGTESPSAPSAPSAEGNWWSAFGDPALPQLVERALARNDDLAIAAARVMEARALSSLARAQQLPALDASLAAARQADVSPFGQPRTQNEGQAELRLSYDLDLFGRLEQTSAASRAALLATEAGRQNVRLAISAAVADAYINLCALDARLDILHATLDARSASLHLAKRRSEAGYAPALDLWQAQAEYHATEQLIPAALLAIRRQENALSVLLGEAPQDFPRSGSLGKLLAPEVPLSLPSSLLRRRPDLIQAEQQLVAADHSLDAVRASFMPSVRLGASGGVVASNLLNNPIAVFSLGGSVLAPLLDSGRLDAQQDAAVARRDQAAFAYRKAVLTAFREVEDARAAAARNAEQATALGLQRDALFQVQERARKRYRSGYAPYLEQLDAQRSYLNAELALVQAQAEQLAAHVRLYQALGGEWR
ncbi:MAG: efflux transporter outer membrane subunit [Pseudomonadota bacterium]